MDLDFYYKMAIAGATTAGIGVLLAGGLYLNSRYEHRRFVEEPNKEREKIRKGLQNAEIIGTLHQIYRDDVGRYKTRGGQIVEPTFLGSEVLDIKPSLTLPRSRTDSLLDRIHPSSKPQLDSRHLDNVLASIGDTGKKLSANYFSLEDEKEVHSDLVVAACYFK